MREFCIMNEFPVIGSLLYTQRVLGSPGGKKIARSCKEMYSETYFDVQKNDYRQRSTVLSTLFYQKSIGAMLTRRKCTFMFE